LLGLIFGKDNPLHILFCILTDSSINRFIMELRSLPRYVSQKL
jgi:hypothetical protein